MTAFARAAAVLFADRNLGEDVLRRAGGMDPAITIRAVISAPDDQVNMFGQAIRVPTMIMFCPPDSAVAEGDTIQRGAITYLVRDVARDEHGTQLRVSLDAA